jgi:hypothetical protein
MIFWLALKLEISYQSYNMLKTFGFFQRIFWRLCFGMVKYLSFHNSSFALRYIFNVNGKATMWHIPCWIWEENVETQYLMHEVWKWFCNNDRHNYSITHTWDRKKAPRKRKKRDETHVMFEFGDNLSFMPPFIAMYFLVFLKLFP